MNIDEIEEGQLFIQKQERYPHSAVRVDELVGGDVKFYNMNGGIRQSLPDSKFAKIFREVTEEEKANPQAYASTFGIDDCFEPPLEGYTKGFLWNGWAKPYFEFEAAKRIQEVAGDLKYDEEKDAFIMPAEHEDEEDDEFKGQDLVVNGEVKRVYPIGSGSWVWDDEGPSKAQKAKERKFSNDSSFSP